METGQLFWALSVLVAALWALAIDVRKSLGKVVESIDRLTKEVERIL